MRDFRKSLLFLWYLNAIGGVLSFQLSSLPSSTTRTTPLMLHIHAVSSKEIHAYCQLVQKSVEDQQFVSLALKGPSKKKATKDELRGCLAQVQGRLVEISKKKAKSKQIYLQTTFKYHGATDVAKNWNLSNVGETLQELLQSSDGSDYKSEWGTWHASGTPLGLASCTLVTTLETTEMNLATLQTKTSQSANKKESSSSSSVDRMLIAPHDRTKNVPVAQEAPFWQAIGLTKKPAKRRQCQKFVEIVGNLIQKKRMLLSNTNSAASASSSISTVDMGCGRGYLTFALHHYLQEAYATNTTSGAVLIQTRGIDMRPKLVAEMNAIASTLDGMTPGLVFETGTIESCLLAAPGTNPPYGNDPNVAAAVTESSKQLQLLIALHACDTATDDALWSGIQSKADIIVVAPCCHKQVRPQLDASMDTHPLKDVLRYGIYRERMAETVTDAMRALLLELAHYQVQVFEFIGGEHTAKNVMITAVRLPRPRSEVEMNDLRRRLQELAQLHGIRWQTLAQWMKEDLTVGDSSEGVDAERQSSATPSLSAKVMPPL